MLSEKTECICGKDFVKERILDKTFRIGPNTFFQVNPQSAENIFKYVKDYLQENFDNPTVLDAYAGVTSFGISVCDNCKQVVSVEENKEAVNLASEIIKLNNIENVEIIIWMQQNSFKNKKKI
ncbi:MAG: RsmD family RNA methyltransferase [Candidatus Gastranaerophilaceae bacterium]